jgi:DNA-binding XRE family transcriptional regulator
MGHERTDAGVLRLCNAVARLREERGWTLDELALRAGVARRGIVRIESGDHKPNASVMLRLAQAFGLPLSEVFWSDDASSAA